MIETFASATDFRQHIAQITNCVAYRQDRCVIMRHGREVAALVSWEDLEFLRKHKPRKIGPPSVDVFSAKAAWRDHFPDTPGPEAPSPDVPPDPGPDPEETVMLEDPFYMSIQDIIPLHEELSAREGESLDLDVWLARARICLQGAGLYRPRPRAEPGS